MTTAQMAAVFGLAVGVVTDRLSRRGARWRMFYVVAMVTAAAPVLWASALIANTPLAIFFFLLFSLTSGGLTTVTLSATIAGLALSGVMFLIASRRMDEDVAAAVALPQSAP